jgi:hypothetical protein
MVILERPYPYRLNGDDRIKLASANSENLELIFQLSPPTKIKIAVKVHPYCSCILITAPMRAVV